jgi:phospholipid/cholesterol/gamma-HCH transport system substrate-binding protein
LQAGALGVVFLILLSYGAYTKFANPLASHFTIHAVFPNANGLNPDSLVRIAGVNVGKVTGVSSAPGCSNGVVGKCQAADVTMQIEGNGLPIHQDATFAIRPRIFLEGNFFVDVHPGSPSAPIVPGGHTFPIQQGTEPVQLDRVLGALQANTRQNLQILLDQYGKAVDQSGPSYNRSIQYWLPAYKYTAIVSHDALGIQPHDLSNWVAQMGTVSGALDAHPQNLENLITDFNTTANSFARQNTALANAVAELPTTLATAIPAFNALNAAFPPLRALARTLEPGVVSAAPAITVSLPFINQLRQLVQPAELGGLTADLSVTVPALARLAQTTIPLMKNGVRPAASCVANVIYPWSQLTLNDHTLSGTPGFPLRPVYVEAVDFLPGLAGESRVFDANGPYIRVLGNGGSLTYSLQPGLFGQALAPITSVQPQLPPGGTRPPLHSGIPCETQAPITDLSAPAGPPLKQAATDLSAPGAALRWKSAAQATVGLVRDIAKQQGTSVTLAPSVKQALK